MYKVVCGMEAGIGYVCIEKNSTNAKVSMLFMIIDVTNKQSDQLTKQKDRIVTYEKMIPRAHAL